MSGGLLGAGCETTPMPILLALPSNPMAIIVAVVWFLRLRFDASKSRGVMGKCSRDSLIDNSLALFDMVF